MAIKTPIPCEDRTSPYVLDILVHHISSLTGSCIKSNTLHVRPEDGIDYVESHFTPWSDDHPTLRLYPGGIFYFEYDPNQHAWVHVNQLHCTRKRCSAEEVQWYASYLSNVD